MKTLIIASLLLVSGLANAITIGPGDPTQPKVCVIVNGQLFCN